MHKHVGELVCRVDQARAQVDAQAQCRGIGIRRREYRIALNWRNWSLY
ncbi:hypothetical protein GF108_03495 [Phyllobacterium sp. SYP-B3895]|nr:hypothetical protein [Phyllobacterium sp. SYP-B3895]MRG54644.1 hypothetical protein [Phyllobacterium sp. SYP-B3895]